MLFTQFQSKSKYRFLIGNTVCSEAGSLTSILNRMEEKGLIERKMLNGNRRTFHIFMTESGKKNQKLVEEAFKKIEKTALNGISEEEQKLFMDIFCRIYRNLADMK